MKEKGFVLFLVVIGVLVFSALVVAGYVYFRDQSRKSVYEREYPPSLQERNGQQTAIRLSKKPLNELNYLAYLKNEVIERNEKGFTKNRYTLVVVKEDGSEKKVLFSYIRDGIDANQSARSLGYIYGKDNILLRRIKGGNEDIKFFNKTGEDPLVLSFYRNYEKELGFGLGDYGFGSPFHTFSVDNKLLAYVKNRNDYSSPTTIAVFDLESNTEKTYKLDKNYNENGPVLYLSPDNQKLYVCACVGFYFTGPSLGMWEVDLENGQITSLDYINELEFRNGIFRYDPNSVYGVKYEAFEREQVEGTSQRSKTLYKVDLDTRKITTIGFSNYFEDITVSETGDFAHTIYNGSINEQGGIFVKNLKTGEEFKLEVLDLGAWADNDKLAFNIGDPEETDTIKLYIYNPADKTKILIETLQVEKGTFCCKSRIEIIGWIH